MRRVAVVGSGISGLAVAHGLRGDARVTLFEAGQHFGGHTHTVDMTLDGTTHGVDTGFLVFNERTYPALVQLFAALDIDTAPAEMSFSVQAPGLEWSGTNLAGLFAQRSNLVRPRFWGLLSDLLRFNRLATRLARASAGPTPGGATERVDAATLEPIGDFLDRHRFGAAFRDGYLLPMLGCIWSCPVDQMLRFPVATMLRFCHNHGLLQIADRPQWRTVRGGARRYVEKMLASIPDARLATPVRQLQRGLSDGGPPLALTTDAGTERFDEVVLACHSDQALALLADPTDTERALLGAIRYQRNEAVLHTDATLLPTRRQAWAAWNYERAADPARERAGVCLHYWLNRLQPLPFTTPVIVSLNPVRAPRADTVHARIAYAHPVFDAGAIAAQARLPALQLAALATHTWYGGAWTRYGFHEDGLRSGLAVCDALRAAWAATDQRVAEAA